MNALVMCLAVVAGGIEVGWERLPEGGVEYIIHLDPQVLDSLKAGQAIQSDIPVDAGDVRSYRILLGTSAPPREPPPLRLAPPKSNGAGLPVLPSLPTPDPAQNPLVEHTSAEELANPSTPADATKSPSEPAKPWAPFTCAMLGLFASIAANVYIGWIAWGLRERVRRNLTTASSLPLPDSETCPATSRQNIA